MREDVEMEVEPKWPAWSISRRRRVRHLFVSTRTKRTNRIVFALVLLSMRFDWSRVETKCPMCKQRFYWIEREAKEKKEKEKKMRVMMMMMTT